MKQAIGKPEHEVVPEGRYADRFKIGYRACVFVLDFDQSFYEDEREHVHTRIITSPEDLKSFLELLQKTIEQYEKIYGPISVGEEDTSGLCD